jgi:hypothetical protein
MGDTSVGDSMQKFALQNKIFNFMKLGLLV